MKTIYIYILIIYCITFCTCNAQQIIHVAPENIHPSGDQQAIRKIREFYTAYMENDHAEKSFHDSIREKYLTKEMIAKIERIGNSTGADAVIRAQDINPENIRTLTVKYLTGNWYMVSYTWINDGTNIDIPIRITKTNNQYKIDYITPDWNKIMYGDSLLIDHPVINPIDDSSPLSLLKTFYDAYTTEYCSMPEDLSNRLKGLRQKFCTEKALKQFEEAFEYVKKDGYPGFDLLINGFDFDRLWIPSMTYKQISGDDYEISYIGNESSLIIRLNVIKQENAYRINGIKAKPFY